jgi:hypothetical protein
VSPIEHDSLERALDERLDAATAERLAKARTEVAADPARIAVVFPGVGRMVGRGLLTAETSSAGSGGQDRPGGAAAADDPHAWTVADAARTLLLVSLGDQIDAEMQPLYRHGDGEERRGVLRALPFLELDRELGVALVEDALRTNDVRLIAAACGPYAAAELDDDAIAQATLKCVFVGVPLGGFVGLEDRLTPEIAAMLARFAHERVAAGRDVPDDIWTVANRFPATEEVAAIEAELDHPDEGRRAAARRALDRRALLGATPSKKI